MNVPYDHIRYKMVTAGFNWLTTPLQLFAWAGPATFIAAEKTIAEFKTHGATEVGRSLPINHQAVDTDGTTQTDQVVIPTPPVGLVVTHFTMAKQATGDAGELILFVDDADEMPFTTNGLDIVVSPDWILNRGWFRA